MNKIALFTVLFAGMLSWGVPALRAQSVPEAKGFSCGLNATYIFLNRAGHHASYDKLVSEFLAEKYPDSLLAIKEVLQKHGCKTIGMRTEPEYFLSYKGPAIVYLQLSGFSPKTDKHFAYLLGVNRQVGAKFLDPVFDLTSASIISWDSFTRAYQGDALIPNE